MSDLNKTLLISKEQVKKTLNNTDKCVSLIEEAFKEYIEGSVILPEKISQIFDDDTQSRINCMPATLKEKNISGIKWVSVFPDNPKYGIENVSGLIILSELNHGRHVAVMDGTIITNLRTAALGACAVKYLARKNSGSIGFIGAGQEARMHLDMIASVRDIKTCYVSSRSDSSVENFIQEEKNKHPDIIFINCEDNYKKAIKDSDIIITATSAQKDLLKADWIKKGATYIHVGGWEDEFDVPKLADKIICDSWEKVKHRGQTISRMYKLGLLSDSEIYCDFDKILSGEKVGRESEDEFIYFNSVGLAFVDIYYAKYVYDVLKDSEVSSFEF